MEVKNISLLGHKDHGKSTLIGSLLMQTGAATKVRIKEAEEYSTKLGKPFEPAFILDSFTEEREQEMTYDTTRAEIKYKDIALSLIDVPGHEELIKNMISGASYGEVALLLVSANKDEGIRDQTKRHLFISRMLGIDKLVVAVNKMDTVSYDEKRFDEIRDGLSGFIEKIGFRRSDVRYVPISAYNGENLVERSRFMKWYRAKPLIDEVYDFASRNEKQMESALRMIVQGVIPSESGELVVGRIISGRLHVSEAVKALPAGFSSKISEITVKGKRVRSAKMGENVAVKLAKSIKIEMRGSIISSAADAPKLTDSVKSKIFVTGRIGGRMSIKFNGSDIPCRAVKVLYGINPATGEEKSAKEVKPLDAVEAELLLSRKLPVERYKDTKELGRFVLYSGKEFVGIGTVV